ncbi:hypothetical protein [Pontimicrobium sp. SW4]|uniref:Uncharacterized protein n=1 Tax=Pontimicrobium sp. SW4 TaxID=3153519 RepID=A0AAU7BPH4_9FLAO
MKRIAIMFCLTIVSVSFCFGQTVYDDISKEICDCAESKQIKSYKEIESCMQSALFKNINALLVAEKVELITELNEDVFDKIGVHFTKNCEYALELVEDTVKEKIPETKEPNALECNDLTKGNYYYVHEIELDEVVVDTTYVSISDRFFVETMNNGKSYSLLEFQRKGDCNFDLTFVESNDEFKGQISNKGDIFNYEIVSSTPNSFFIKTTYQGKIFHFELIKANR